MVLILLQVCERDLEYPSLESIVGVLETGGAVYERLADTAGELVAIEESLRRGGRLTLGWQMWREP
jgi:hypothetical protein